MSMERILWFDEQIRAGRNPRSADLAARFHISIRTAQRDIEALRNRLEAPLKIVTREKRYTYGDEPFDLPSAFLGKDEIVALLLTRRLFKNLKPPLRQEAAAISGRLDELFESPLLEKLDEVVSVDAGLVPEVPGKIFFELLRAIVGRKNVRLRLAAPGESKSGGRGIEVVPFGLHLSHGAWLLLAYPSGKKAARAYPLSRIRGVEVTARHFVSPPKKPSADAALRKAAGFRGGKVRDSSIRFSPAKAAWVSGQQWHPRQRLQFELDGSAVLELPEARILWVLGLILQQRGDASVIGPVELREAVDAEMERLAAIYQDKNR
jgi:predicted DNA-binding transcriptional regulator YafY